MARDRERVCEHYKYEGCCSKGRGGRFRKDCQTCDKYSALAGAKPARPDLRHEKRIKQKMDRRNWE